MMTKWEKLKFRFYKREYRLSRPSKTRQQYVMFVLRKDHCRCFNEEDFGNDVVKSVGVFRNNVPQIKRIKRGVQK